MTPTFRLGLMALLICATAFGQEERPRFEFGPFGGVSRYRVNQDAPNKAGWVDGGLVGFRATGNLNGRLSLEFSGTVYGVNNVRVPLSGARPVPQIAFGSRTYEAWVGPVFNLLSADHKWTPFVKAGPALMYWVPTDDAKRELNRAPYFANPRMSMQPAAVAGVGIKGYFSRRIGVRVDLDGTYSGQPHYKLQGVPGAPGTPFIPTRGGLFGMQLTAELFFGVGRLKEPAPPPAPAPKPAPPEPALSVTSPDPRTIDAGCPGDATQPIELTVSATSNLPGHTPKYQWTVDGSPAGENSPTFRFTVPQTPGQHTVAVTVSDDPSGSSDTRTATPVTRQLLVATVRAAGPPTISGSASPSEITRGQTSALSINAQAGACGGTVSYTCQPTEGAVTGTPPTMFDSSNVAFDMSDRSKPQSKTVNITCTATDSKSGTASTTIPVVVGLPAELTAQRFDDVVFPANNARVNNCGKRILLEEVARQMAEHPDWDLVLVGHSTAGERAPRRGTTIDRERVLNVVATLTAKTDTCGSVDLSRIKVAYAGTAQQSEPRPAFCGTSTRPAANERRGQAVAATDPGAANRRVEIYLVPKGAPLPNAAGSYEVVPQSVVAPRGCPK